MNFQIEALTQTLQHKKSNQGKGKQRNATNTLLIYHSNTCSKGYFCKDQFPPA